MVIPDTSVWIHFLRGGQGADAEHLSKLIAEGEVAVCGPVVAELLAGAGEEQRQHLLDSVVELPWAELSRSGWLQIGELARGLRRAGEKLPLTDLAIAVAASRARYSVWTHDSDFERIASALPELELHSGT